MNLELAQNTDNRSSLPVGVSVQQRSNEATRFQPGRTGNPHGRPPSARFRRAALKQLRQEIAAGIDRLDCITDAVISKAEAGDIGAYTVLRDTVDGKPSGNDAGGNSTQIFIAVENIGGE